MIKPLPQDLEKDLVAAALRFREAEPWRELANSDYLLVKAPGGGYGVLAIMGNAGMEFGLHSYDSSCIPDLLYWLEDWQSSGSSSAGAMLERIAGACLDLVNKSETRPADRALLAKVGYKPAPRVRRAWPVFTQFRPGAFPWHIDESTARRLTLDLDRAIRWAQLAAQITGRSRHTSIAFRHLPVVPASLPVNRPWTPEDLSWLQLPPPASKPATGLPVTEPEKASLAALPRKPSEWWWVDERAQMMRIQESADSLPWFPRLGLCLDGRTGFSYPPGTAPAGLERGLAVREALVGAIKTCHHLPGELRTTSQALIEALAPWSSATGVPLRLYPQSDLLDNFWQMMEQFDRR